MRRLFLAVVLAVAPAAHAEDAGRTLYLRLCASCHGRDGAGDGPVAPALGQKPSDLTQIAAANAGTFPFVEVAEAIDGTKSVRAHGVSDMPIWGEVLQTDPASPLEQQLLAAGRVIVITRYVRTLQRPAPASR